MRQLFRDVNISVRFEVKTSKGVDVHGSSFDGLGAKASMDETLSLNGSEFSVRTSKLNCMALAETFELENKPLDNTIGG